ncbi:hypothetical protein EcE24377A_4958 [Escherichia coli O139:H28 str. E24377A]|uniref:Uncharacterized protein n=1 Tax=Escherichia coli O139:H28 (strain E24377A / ETEC) TaxID=331111 RepID=A7ZVQ5_ECO24|nr:hypothetical protein EcE24377A_4958 [Escherichia coli O139:H28 str. E24377A]OSK19825.1 hypothetical protein EALG_02207 [Escherichia coli TA144]OSK58473.1 hypothetical protein EACG_03652 [Escherichia coli E560]OSK65109.1 hypothetical protein EADG_00254 [Escherichia coli E1114]OSL63715.1 hypothetical protein EASG_03688 [Escherichia coli H383]
MCDSRILREGISFNYKLNECDFCFSLSIPNNLM